MILIALGSNMSGPWGTPRETLMRALIELNTVPLRLVKVSNFIESKPWGEVNQPNFINAVAKIETALSADALIRKLHAIEHQAGRRRAKRWGPRTLDLDIIDYKGEVRNVQGNSIKELRLPHPAIADRDFVLLPIAEIAPRWRHPVSQQSAAAMIQKLYRLNQS